MEGSAAKITGGELKEEHCDQNRGWGSRGAVEVVLEVVAGLQPLAPSRSRVTATRRSRVSKRKVH